MPGPGGTIFLSDGDDQFPDSGDDNSGSETIFARNGSDTVSGGVGNDVLFGGGADDRLFGGDDADSLDGGDGDDLLDGGIGNDTITDFAGLQTSVFGGGGDDYITISNFSLGGVINGSQGRDTLALGSPVNLEDISLRGLEDLVYFDFTGTITAKAGQFENFSSITTDVGGFPAASISLALAGKAGVGYTCNLAQELKALAVNFVGSLGDDTLTTGRGDDTVYGDAGLDALYGGRGADLLFGDADDDTLGGGRGGDLLYGGFGNDTFVFKNATESNGNRSVDRIFDWSLGDDRVDLSAVGAFTFMGQGTGGGAGTIWYTTTAFDTTVSIYVDADSSADMVIGIAGQVVLTGADFV